MSQAAPQSATWEDPTHAGNWVSCGDALFIAGSPLSEPGRKLGEEQREVYIGPIAVMTAPVTVAMYRRYVRDDPARGDIVAPPWWAQDRYPVSNVNWHQAVDYADWLSRLTGWPCRLPTEMEWEYACKAGRATAFSCGRTLKPEHANFDDRITVAGKNVGTYLGRTTPVRSYLPNPLGIYDMHGNVQEWTATPCTGKGWIRSDPATLGMGQEYFTCRVLRGGGYTSPAAWCRSAARNWTFPVLTGFEAGFRLVRDLP